MLSKRSQTKYCMAPFYKKYKTDKISPFWYYCFWDSGHFLFCDLLVVTWVRSLCDNEKNRVLMICALFCTRYISIGNYNEQISKVDSQAHRKGFFLPFFFKIYLFIFRERGREGEREREKDTWIPHTHNPGMCPDQESNQQPFALQDDAQPTEPHRSKPIHPIRMKVSQEAWTFINLPHSAIIF